MEPEQSRAEDLFRKAVASYQSSDYSTALEICERIFQLPPATRRLAAGYNLKALSLAGLGNMIDAVTAIRQAIAISPQDARLHLHSARLLFSLGRHRTALRHLQTAAQLAPSDPEPDFQAARIYQSLEQIEAALKSARASVRKHGNNLEGWMLLAELCAEQGNYAAALENLRPALDCRPLLARAWAWLAEMEPRLDSGLPIDDRLRQARDQADTDEDYATAVFALAHRKRRAGLHAEAFALYRQANRRLAAALPFAIEDWESRVDEIIAASERDGDTGSSRGEAGWSDNTRVIFICGMPRSGTSLCEQVICSHPEVHGAGELPTMEYIEKCLRQRGMDPYGEDPSGWLEEMREVYINSLPFVAGGQRLLSDKAPRNFERVGLILRLFPEARLVWMLRNPLDTILSCYFQDFASSHHYSTRLDHISRVYLGHLKLLRHWKGQFADRIMVVRYREMVLGLEATARRLARFIGLGFHPAMLQPHLNPRIVRTSSALQVRQPVYTRSLGRWKDYAGEISDLAGRLQARGVIDAQGRMKFRP